jgi:hypothetical protein
VNIPLRFRRLFDSVHACLHGPHHVCHIFILIFLATTVLLPMLVCILVLVRRSSQDGLRLRPLAPTKATWRRPRERWSHIHYGLLLDY